MRIISDKFPVRNGETEVFSGQKGEVSEKVGTENKKRCFYAKNSAERTWNRLDKVQELYKMLLLIIKKINKTHST